MAEELTINLNDEQITVPQWAKEETQKEIAQLLRGSGPAKSLGKDLKKVSEGAKGFDKSLKGAIRGPTKLEPVAIQAAKTLQIFGRTVKLLV